MHKRFGILFEETLDVMRGHWPVLMGAALVFSLLPALVLQLGFVPLYGTIRPEGLTLYDFVQALLSGLFSLILTLAVLDYLRKRKGTLKGSVRSGLGRFREGLWLSILLLLKLLGLFLLLIVPGIIYCIRWSFVYYALIDGKGVQGSFAYSKKLVDGRWWRVLGYSLLLILIIVGVSLVLILPLTLVSAVLGAFDASSLSFGIVLALVTGVSAAIGAVATVFSLVFYERFYRALEAETKGSRGR